jgi:PBP1b-binding outer membrane lipoprotein LpoB
MIANGVKMLKNIITLMFAAFLVHGCSDLDKVSSPPNSIKKSDTIVCAEGRWNHRPQTKIKFIAKINSVSIYNKLVLE